MGTIYKILRITDRFGNDRRDELSRARIGRFIDGETIPKVGFHGFLWCVNRPGDSILTSKATHVRKWVGGDIELVTMNSIYQFIRAKHGEIPNEHLWLVEKKLSQ